MLNINKIKQILIKKIKPINIEKKQAAVIVPIFKSNDDMYVIFEKRVNDGSVHSGQISFPGGSIEQNDISIEHAALRETEEEIGIKQNKIEILGALEPTITLRSDFVVYPFVGILKDNKFNINKQEIDKLFGIPLTYLIDSYPFKTQLYTYNNRKYNTFVIEYKNEIVWGATARITSQFIEKIKYTLNKEV